MSAKASSPYPPPTLDNWSETCDWGHCNGQSYAVRWADDLSLWLAVCRKHRAGGVVLFDTLVAAADAAEPPQSATSA